MARLRCPVCDVALGEAQAHCPRCGLRVAPLERRAAVVTGPGKPPPPLLPRSAAARTRRALLVGAAAGSILTVVCLAAGVVVHVAGGPGRSVAGNSLLAVVAVAIVAAGLSGGVHVRRWGSYEELRDRARAGFGSNRAALCGTALPALLALVLLALLDH